MKWWDWILILVFLILSCRPVFSLSSFSLIKSLLSFSSLSAIRVVSSAYLRSLIFLPALLIPACNSSSLAFHMMYPAYKLNKQSNSSALTYSFPDLTNLSQLGFPCGSAGKEAACNVVDLGLIPGFGRYPGEVKGYQHHYSGLENSTDCIVQSRARLSNFHFTFLLYSRLFSDCEVAIHRTDYLSKSWTETF